MDEVPLIIYQIAAALSSISDDDWDIFCYKLDIEGNTELSIINDDQLN